MFNSVSKSGRLNVARADHILSLGTYIAFMMYGVASKALIKAC